MKENRSFGYENHTDELKKSLAVGTTCVGIVAGRLWEANKEIIEYRIKDAIHTRQRTAHLKGMLKRV